MKRCISVLAIFPCAAVLLFWFVCNAVRRVVGCIEETWKKFQSFFEIFMLYVAAPHKLKITQFGTTKVPANFPNVQTCAIDRHFYYYRIMASRMQPIQPTLRADIPSSTTVRELLYLQDFKVTHNGDPEMKFPQIGGDLRTSRWFVARMRKLVGAVMIWVASFRWSEFCTRKQTEHILIAFKNDPTLG